MGKLVMLGAGAALIASGAPAQMGPGAGYPPPGATPPRPMPQASRPYPTSSYPGPSATMRSPQHWGSSVGGPWWGGVNAPGGYASYRQPYRGYRVPSYWVSPRFNVSDYSYYALPQPLSGYRWVRYYDDAVMIDRGGSVYDYRSGIDWDGRYDDRRSNGLGGAIAGAAVGGVAGNLIAGRGDRLGGTLIGAGVGGAAGYAIDRSRDRRGSGARYDAYRDGPSPYAGDYGYDDYSTAGPSTWVSPDGSTTVTTGGGGYVDSYPVVSAPYGYMAGGSVTTVTIQGAPMVTTTTTEEIVEDRVSYTRPVVRRAYGKRVYRARTKLRPRCDCR